MPNRHDRLRQYPANGALLPPGRVGNAAVGASVEATLHHQTPGHTNLFNATITTVTLKETLEQLEALGTEKVRAQNAENGAGDNQFGVRLGDKG